MAQFWARATAVTLCVSVLVFLWMVCHLRACVAMPLRLIMLWPALRKSLELLFPTLSWSQSSCLLRMSRWDTSQQTDPPKPVWTSRSADSGQDNRKLFWHPGHSPQSRTVDLVRDPGTACQKWAGKETSVLPTNRQHRPRCLHTPGFLHLGSYWERVWCLPKNSRVGDLQPAQRPAIPSGDGCHPSEARVCYTSVEHHLPLRQQAFVYAQA